MIFLTRLTQSLTKSLAKSVVEKHDSPLRATPTSYLNVEKET